MGNKEKRYTPKPHVCGAEKSLERAGLRVSGRCADMRLTQTRRLVTTHAPPSPASVPLAASELAACCPLPADTCKRLLPFELWPKSDHGSGSRMKCKIGSCDSRRKGGAVSVLTSAQSIAARLFLLRPSVISQNMWLHVRRVLLLVHRDHKYHEKTMSAFSYSHFHILQFDSFSFFKSFCFAFDGWTRI